MAPQSPIRKLVAFSDAAKERGIDVYHLNIGQPDFEMPEPIQKELQNQVKRKSLPYAASPGLAKTRQAWATYYQAVNINLTPEQVIITTGGTEAIMLALWTVLDEGDSLIAFEPGYANYAGYAIQTGLKLIPIAAQEKKGFHLPPAEQIIRKIDRKTKAIIVTNPNNPTGTVLTPAEIDLIIEIAKKYDLFIIADETYRGLVFDGRKNPSFYTQAKAKKAEKRVIIVDSLSKRLNVCGARLGALASANQEVISAANKLAQNRLCVATLEQEIVTSMLANCLSYVEKIKNQYQKRRDLLYHLLDQEPTIKLTKPEGAFYTLPTLPVEGEKFSKWLLTDFNENGETVMVAPGSGFYFTPNKGKNQIRVAYVLEEIKLARAVELLVKGLRVYQAKKS